MLAIPVAASAHHIDKYKQSCFKKYDGVRSTKCFIKRAAEHYGQNVSQAKYTAWCESRYDLYADSNYPYKGLYQYDGSTWAGAPYHHKSIWSARYQALNTMWYWKQGERSRWPECG